MPKTDPCPYCGTTPSPDATKCQSCGGLFEPLSRTVTQMAMGAWQIRDEAKPFMPGFNLGILMRQVAAGRIKPDTVLRGPTTHQFWMRADRAPGVSRLLGQCHACHAVVKTDAESCPKCKADLSLPGEVDALGLMYTTPEERKAAQEQITAGKTGKAPAQSAAAAVTLTPIAKPTDKPVSKADGAEASHVELTPVSKPESKEDAGPADAIDELWAAGDEVAASRRKRGRSQGANGPIIAVLVLSLVVMLIGGIVIIGGDQTGGGEGEDPFAGGGNGNGSAQAPADRKPQIGPEEVAGVRKAVEAQLEEVQAEETPAGIMDRLEALRSALADAEAQLEIGEYEQSMQAYAQVGRDIAAFETFRERYIADAEVRAEAEAARAEMATAKASASAREAERWAGDTWAQGLDAEGLADLAMQEGEYLEARRHYDDARFAYQEAQAVAETAEEALASREALFTLMKNSAPRQLLEKHAAEDFNQSIESQNQGAQALSAREYAAALDYFTIARDRLTQANGRVDRARNRRYYAFLAGYDAADLLLTMAARDELTNPVLNEVRAKLENLDVPERLLRTLPTQGPAPEEDEPAEAAYEQASELLMNAVRRFITDTHGQDAQLSYAAGVKARIIEKTLSFDVLTSDHRSAAATGANDLVDHAAQAGWDMARINTPVTQFRDALRRDTVGQKAVEAPAAWAQVLSLLKSDQGRAIMTVDFVEGAGEPPNFFTE